MTRRSLIAPTAVIFDFDLTIADSRPGFVASHIHAAHQLGVPVLDEETIARSIGTPLDLVVPEVYPDMAPEAVVEYIRTYRAKADEVMVSLTTMLPSAAATVRYLHDERLRLAIVSQKLRHLVFAVLERYDIAECFEIVLGGQDVPAFKPDPRGLQLALDRLGVDADDALYVGDTVIDAEAAANAGLRFIGVLTGPTRAVEFESYDKLTLLDSVNDLPGYLGV
jgi:phosphoglycolate phosphatase